jgi:hypothetical protein
MMSLAYDSDTETPEYVSRTEIHYMFRVSMAMVAKAVDKGQLELHFIDGKILAKSLRRKRSLAETNQTFSSEQRPPVEEVALPHY